MTSSIGHVHLNHIPFSTDANTATKKRNQGNALSQGSIPVELYTVLKLELKDTFLDVLISEV